MLGIIALILVAAWGISRVNAARHTGKYLEDLAGQDPSKVVDAMSELRARGASVAPRLVELVQTGQGEAAGRAAMLLGEIGSHDGDAALTSALNSKGPIVRTGALQALGQLRVSNAVSAIAAVLADKEEKSEVRASAAYALGMIGSETAISPLAEVLKDHPAPAPPAAPEASAAAPAAATPAPDTTISIRVAAAKALGLTKLAAAVDPLVAAMDEAVEPAPEVRVAASYAIGDVTAASDNASVTNAALPALGTALKDKAADVRIAAVYSLGKLSVPDAARGQVVEMLKSAQADNDYWVRLAATKSKKDLKLE